MPNGHPMPNDSDLNSDSDSDLKLDSLSFLALITKLQSHSAKYPCQIERGTGDKGLGVGDDQNY